MLIRENNCGVDDDGKLTNFVFWIVEEAVSPNGDYGGPLKKRRFARESMSEQTSSSPTATFANSNQVIMRTSEDFSGYPRTT